MVWGPARGATSLGLQREGSKARKGCLGKRKGCLGKRKTEQSIIRQCSIGVFVGKGGKGQCSICKAIYWIIFSKQPVFDQNYLLLYPLVHTAVQSVVFVAVVDKD